jgi:hypothetical protein
MKKLSQEFFGEGRTEERSEPSGKNFAYLMSEKASSLFHLK